MKPIEQRIACAKGEILNAMATISTEHDLSATVMEGVLADILSEVKSQSKMELLNAYNKEVNDAQQEIKQLKEEGAPQNEIQAYQVVLAQLRDTSRLLSGYYDVPRFSENAAVGWKAGKINDR